MGAAMKVLVTAGGTLVPIDQVRSITNSFTGRTGAAIALAANARGHDVVLLTSHPEAAVDLRPAGAERPDLWKVIPYRTFDDLHQLLADHVGSGRFEALIHGAAISDYRVAGIYAPAPECFFDDQTGSWVGNNVPSLVDRSAAKVNSDEPELWLRLVSTSKLVDLVRTEWRFTGVLVKFKLEAGMSESEMLSIAERSRVHSNADLIVANTIEGVADWAVLGPEDGRYQRIERAHLASRLLDAVESLHRERRHG